MPLVEIKKLTFEIGQTKILDDLNLTISFQEIHALLGAYGSGKSTLPYVLTGYEGYGPNTREILFDGQDIFSLQTYERSQLGIPPWPAPSQFEWISVLRAAGRVIPVKPVLAFTRCSTSTRKHESGERESSS